MAIDPHREAQWWRMLLGKVASDLERLASQESDERRARLLRARAMRIRKRLHEGPPENWTPSMPTGPAPKFR
jgi:hypothetical protein